MNNTPDNVILLQLIAGLTVWTLANALLIQYVWNTVVVRVALKKYDLHRINSYHAMAFVVLTSFYRPMRSLSVNAILGRFL